LSSQREGNPIPGFERIVLETDPEVRISVRRYAPATAGGLPVILTHGLLASAEIFDVPGLPQMSLARFLRDRGHPVYAFDQRCAGDSSGPTWDFGLRETSLVDLPAVIRLVVERESEGRVALVAHSLGGLCQYLLLASLGPDPDRMRESNRGVDPGRIAGMVCIASPARFSRELEPWRTITRNPARFLEKIDPDGDGAADLSDFVQSSFLLPPAADRWLPPRVVGAAMRLGRKSRATASLLKRLPLRSFLYDREDFDAATFRKVLDSRTLETGSAALVSEVLRAGLSGGAVAVTHGDRRIVVPEDLAGAPSIPLLTVTSGRDALVPAEDVRHAHRFLAGDHVICERDFGTPSGHAGYFFKEGLRSRLYDRILGFLAGLA